MNTNTPGYLILKKRKEKHLTQQELADKLYVSPTTISKWERGNSRPDLEKLKLLSSVLDIPLPLLLGIDSAETDESPEKTAASETESAEEATVTEKTSSVNESIILKPETAIDEIPPDEKPPKEKLPRKRNRTIAILSVAAVLLVFTAVFFLHSRIAAPAGSNDFSDLEVLRHFHGSYHDVDSCCVIVKCTEDISEDLRYNYSQNIIRDIYGSCFEKVENIVIFYVPDFSENDNLEDTAYYITTLYPLPDFEKLYPNT